MTTMKTPPPSEAPDVNRTPLTIAPQDPARCPFRDQHGHQCVHETSFCDGRHRPSAYECPTPEGLQWTECAVADPRTAILAALDSLDDLLATVDQWGDSCMFGETHEPKVAYGECEDRTCPSREHRARSAAARTALDELSRAASDALACFDRLASGAGFQAVGRVPDNQWGHEVVARRDYARAAAVHLRTILAPERKRRAPPACYVGEELGGDSEGKVALIARFETRVEAQTRRREIIDARARADAFGPVPKRTTAKRVGVWQRLD